MGILIISYAITWAAISGYTALLAINYRRLNRRLERLPRELDAGQHARTKSSKAA